MNTIRSLHEVATQCGNVLRGSVSVSGETFTVESDGETWVNIISSDSGVESCEIDSDGDVISAGGESVTENWGAHEWKQLTEFVGSKTAAGQMCARCAKHWDDCECKMARI